MLNISHVTRQQNIYAIDKDVDVRYYSPRSASEMQSCWLDKDKVNNNKQPNVICFIVNIILFYKIHSSHGAVALAINFCC